MMERYAALVGDVPVLRATFPSGFDALNRLVDAIEAAVATAA